MDAVGLKILLAVESSLKSWKRNANILVSTIQHSHSPLINKKQREQPSLKCSHIVRVNHFTMFLPLKPPFLGTHKYSSFVY